MFSNTCVNWLFRNLYTEKAKAYVKLLRQQLFTYFEDILCSELYDDRLDTVPFLAEPIEMENFRTCNWPYLWCSYVRHSYGTLDI